MTDKIEDTFVFYNHKPECALMDEQHYDRGCTCGAWGANKTMDTDHEHDFKLKLGTTEIVPEPFVIETMHIYAECECGAELDQDQIEDLINDR